MPSSLAALGLQKISRARPVIEAKLPAPQVGMQEAFFSSDVDIVLAGSGAGTGKTMALALLCARHVKNPKYRATIFRRTFPEFTDPGGLVDETQNLYPLIGGRFNNQKMDWSFPSGAKISFRHLQYDATVHRYQGSQICYLCFDELTHFTANSFWYLLSRNRSGSGIKPVVRATCNPDPDSFAAELVSWYLTPDGYPDTKKAGIVRYFFRQGEDQIIWDNSRETLAVRWIERRAHKTESGAEVRIKDQIVGAKDVDRLITKILGNETLFNKLPIKSFTFLPSTIFENKKLLEVNPEYLDNLENLHPVERERLLLGNWKIAYAAGTVFNRAWFEIVEEMPQTEYATVIRFWDFAATDRDSATKTSSYTVGAKLAKFPGDLYYVIDLVIVQITGGEIERLVQRIAKQDGNETLVRSEREGGSSGKILAEQFGQNLKEIDEDINYQAVKPTTSKLSRALPLATAASQGRIKLLKGEWNTDFLNAVGQFDGKTHLPKINDIIDATDGAFNELQQVIPVKFDTLEGNKPFLGAWYD